MKTDDLHAASKAYLASKDDILSMADIAEYSRLLQAEYDKIFVYSERNKSITFKPWSYVIELSRIPTPEALLDWVWHLSEKNWMTTVYIRELIERVYKIKGWTRKSF
jgi:hypothetical protein